MSGIFFFGLMLIGLVIWVVYSSFASYSKASKAIGRISYLESEVVRIIKALEKLCPELAEKEESSLEMEEDVTEGN